MIFAMLFLIFHNLQKMGDLKMRISIFKVFTSSFSSNKLMCNSNQQKKTDCLFTCFQDSLCSSALHNQNKECQMFNKLAEDGDLTVSLGNDVFV